MINRTINSFTDTQYPWWVLFMTIGILLVISYLFLTSRKKSEKKRKKTIDQYEALLSEERGKQKSEIEILKNQAKMQIEAINNNYIKNIDEIRLESEKAITREKDISKRKVMLERDLPPNPCTSPRVS